MLGLRYDLDQASLRLGRRNFSSCAGPAVRLFTGCDGTAGFYGGSVIYLARMDGFVSVPTWEGFAPSSTSSPFYGPIGGGHGTSGPLWCGAATTSPGSLAERWML